MFKQETPGPSQMHTQKVSRIPQASIHTGWEHVISSTLCLLFNGCSLIVLLAVHGSRMLSQTPDFQRTEAQEHLVQSDWFVKHLMYVALVWLKKGKVAGRMAVCEDRRKRRKKRGVG